MTTAPTKKKAARGTKQIVAENADTVKFYRNMSLAASVVQILAFTALYSGISGLLLTILCLIIQVASFMFMSVISKPKLSDNGDILDTGTDLNMEGGITEHVKDIIILTSGVQLGSAVTEYCFLFLLLLPLQAGRLLWKSLIKPWMQQDTGPEEPANNDKRKKMERKIKRVRQ